MNLTKKFILPLGLALLVGGGIHFKQTAISMAPTAAMHKPRKAGVTPKEALFERTVIRPLADKTEKSKTRLQKLMSQETATLYSVNIDWKSREAELISAARQLKKDELIQLGDIVLNRTGRSDEKTVASYLLAMAGEPARPVLRKVAISPIETKSDGDPHSVLAMKRAEEVNLRASAIAAIDELSRKNPQASLQDLAAIRRAQSDPSLQHMVMISLIGIEQGRPGKLNRWLEQVAGNGEAQ
ncbi:hypothetical protein [Bdellovibrio sp. HCB288]|uniref:hypothetical protein n=1 Tax=Bdellovibrio sp. HCB288 TaxID=3394355 RepID=UPI0039B6AA04